MNIQAQLKLFNLSPEASWTDVKKQYRTLAKIHHPDRPNSNPVSRARSEEHMRALNSAYESLERYYAAPRPSGTAVHKMDVDIFTTQPAGYDFAKAEYGRNMYGTAGVRYAQPVAPKHHWSGETTMHALLAFQAGALFLLLELARHCPL